MLPQAWATLVYNDGETHNVSTSIADEASNPQIQISNGTTVNWDSGATYDGTGTNTDGIRIYDTSAYNLNGGSFSVTDNANTGGSPIGISLQSGYSGTVSVNSGSFTYTETLNGNCVFLKSTDGSGFTVNLTGGTVTISEGGAGGARLVYIEENGTVNATGGVYNLTEAGTQTLDVFAIIGGDDNSRIDISGGTYNLNSDSEISLLYLDAGEISLSGGTFSANQTMTGVVDGGNLTLSGTFEGIAAGVYDDSTWTDGTITGILSDGNSITLDLSIGDGTLGTITIIPETSATGMLMALAVSMLLLRRKHRLTN